MLIQKLAYTVAVYYHTTNGEISFVMAAAQRSTIITKEAKPRTQINKIKKRSVAHVLQHQNDIDRRNSAKSVDSPYIHIKDIPAAFAHMIVVSNLQRVNRLKNLCKKFAAIEAAGEFPKYFQGEADRRLVRKYLEHKYGHKCSICGITEWMGKPVPIVVDHIDGNALNRKLENFRLVCPNCDAQLPTYKSKNKHGRKWRRKYEQ